MKPLRSVLSIVLGCLLTPVLWGDGSRALLLDDDRPVPREEPAGLPTQDGPSLRAAWTQEPGAVMALERGLDFLALQQARNPDGSFPRSGYRNEKYAPIGVAALASLAWMAGGSTPGRGPHGTATSGAIDYLLAHADLMPGSPHFGYIAREGDETSKIHGHGFATLALAQAFVSSPTGKPARAQDERGRQALERGQRIHEALLAAVRCIESGQTLSGGWGYTPGSTSDTEGSTTVCLVQALRAARNVGVHVNELVIGSALGYLRETRDERTGRFRYLVGSDIQTTALTAAGVATLNALGQYDSELIAGSLRTIWTDLTDREDGIGEPADFPFYERLYVAQAYWQMDDARQFEDWVRAERLRVLGSQRDDGSWSDPRFGDCYATAMNCLFLALPEGLLPIFQR